MCASSIPTSSRPWWPTLSDEGRNGVSGWPRSGSTRICTCGSIRRAFPGVRRYEGSSEIAQYRGRMAASSPPKYALRLDDNDYPKQLWTFACCGGAFRKLGPSGYALAHIVLHKSWGEGRSDREPSQQAPYGLYTSAANTAFIANAMIRPTDSSLTLRALLFSRATQLYSGVWNLLPPGLSVDVADIADWSLDRFDWPEPVGDQRRTQLFLTFRNTEIERLLALPRAITGQPG